MPNAPPTLGVISRSISFGILSTASASGSRTKCGPCAVEKLRRTGADRILSLGYCWQRVVLDFDRFGGIACSGQSFGYDQRDWLTDVPHPAERKHGTRRVVPRRAVTID